MTTVAVLLGSETPRLWTRALRELTSETSAGFAAIQFAERVCGLALLPWQRWWLIHALELREDGSFRYRTVLTLVARQNGKTFLLKVLALYFMYVRQVPLVLGAAQDLKTARESWKAAYDLAASVPALAAQLAPPSRRGLPPGRRDTTGDETMMLADPERRYVVSAASRGAGRGRSTDLLIMDEVREERDMLAWAALSKTTIARPNSIKALISNAGDDESVLLNQIRGRALSGVAEDIAIFEWSAPDGCAIDDREGWAQANPALGYTSMTEAGLLESLNTDPPEVFRTECLCIPVSVLNPAIDVAAWRDCADPTSTMDEVRDGLVACVDVAPDSAHVTFTVASGLGDGRVQGEVVAAWSSTDAARAELGALLERVKPRAVAWFPGGPAAALAPVFRGMDRWTVVEVKGAAVTEACQTLADLVASRRFVHPDDPLLNAHVAGAQKLNQGDGWRFVRRGAGHVDAAYSMAGAVHTALTLPVEKPIPRSQVF